MAKDFWYSIKFYLLIQRVHGISPFSLRNGKLSPAWHITFLTFLTLTIYTVIISSSIYGMYTNGFFRKIFSNGYLFAIIGCFEIGFSNTAYILLVIISELSKNVQIKCFTILCDIDAVLAKEFRAKIDYLWQRKQSIIIIGMIWCYYQLLSIIIFVKLYQFNVMTKDNFIFVLCYAIEQSTAGVYSCSYINFVSQIRCRFLMIRNAQMSLLSTSKYDQKAESRIIRKVSILINTYKSLCELVTMLNENFGLALVLRYTHDFTLTTSQIYMIFWIIIDNHDNDKLGLILYVVLWMTQNIVKMIGVSLETEWTANEVSL